MNRADFKKLAITRLGDAQALLRGKRFGAAYYLAGYAVECALKACVAKKTKRYDFPPEPKFVRECYTHALETLVGAGGLSDVLRAKSEVDPVFELNWSVVKDWNERSRYESHSAKEARELLVAISDPTSGVLACLKQYW